MDDVFLLFAVVVVLAPLELKVRGEAPDELGAEEDSIHYLKILSQPGLSEMCTTRLQEKPGATLAILE